MALRRARDGSDRPFAAVDWDQAVENHPVAREVLAALGDAASGGDARRRFMAPPFGWPKDAIDAALVALCRGGTLRATLNGQPATADQLDQTTLQKAQFSLERVRLGTQDKLALRSLFLAAGVSARPNEEEASAAAFLKKLEELGSQAGGESPLPSAPDLTWLDDLRRLSGNERLAAIRNRDGDFREKLEQWRAKAELAKQRLPRWQLLCRMVSFAEPLPDHAQVQREIEAIRAHRALLEGDDPTVALLAKLGAALRAAVTERVRELGARREKSLGALAGNPTWRSVDETNRAEILRRHGLQPEAPPPLGCDEDLFRALEQRPLAAWADAVAAVPERERAALEDAARLLQPKTRRVALAPATLETEAQVKAWLAAQEKTLLAAIQEGPVIVG